MKLSYTKYKDCISFWAWLWSEWFVREKRKRHNGWRFCGITWDKNWEQLEK